MAGKVSTCLYIDRRALETARQMGLNVSRVAENGLKDAIARLDGSRQETVPRIPPSLIVRAGAGI